MTFTPEQIVTLVVPTLTALAAFFQGRHNATKIEEIHLTVNSRLSALLESTEAAARAAGHAAGRAEEASKMAATKASDAAEKAAARAEEAAKSASQRAENAAVTVAAGMQNAVTEATKVVIKAVKDSNGK